MSEREGWQDEKATTHKRYHYIVDTMSLCRKLGFYMGALMPAKPAPRGAEDCAECHRRLHERKGWPA